MVPPVAFGCLLSLNPPTFTIGFITLVFTPVLLAPENPQSYDPQTFLMNGLLVVVAAVILFLTIRLVLPISASQHRAFALEEARRDLAEALVGEGGDATTRTSLNADRLFQFSAWNSGSGAVRRASLHHAFAVAQLEASRLLTRQAAWIKDQGQPFKTAASMAKLLSTESCMKITMDAVQTLGGYGYIEEYTVERYMREAKMLQIVEGTSQIQRLVIAKGL